MNRSGERILIGLVICCLCGTYFMYAIEIWTDMKPGFMLGLASRIVLSFGLFFIYAGVLIASDYFRSRKKG